ncbi:MAG: hypothetical protein ACFFBH_03925 [Promethearchaeota archaeon]
MKFIVKEENSDQETSEDKEIISKITKEDELFTVKYPIGELYFQFFDENSFK